MLFRQAWVWGSVTAFSHLQQVKAAFMLLFLNHK